MLIYKTGASGEGLTGLTWECKTGSVDTSRKGSLREGAGSQRRRGTDGIARTLT